MSDSAATQASERPWALFNLGRDLFAVALERVQEVLMYQPLTPVPLAPAHVAGLLNLRGELVPTVDLRRRFTGASRPADALTSLIVVRTDDGPVSLVVDSIADIVVLAEAQWQPPPRSMPGEQRACVRGVQALDQRDVLSLNVEAVVDGRAVVARQEGHEGP